MKYRKNIFGKTVIDDESPKPSLRSRLDNNSNMYTAKQIGQLHCLAGFVLIWEIYYFLGKFFNINLKIQKENPVPGILLIFGLPLIFGLLRILVLDRFFDRISWKIKWWFTGFSYAVFILMIIVSVIQK